MKTLIKTLGIIGIFSMSGLAMAEEQDQCPDHLTVDQMYDCIVEYGAGGEYTLPPQQTSSADGQQQKQSNENELAQSEK